MRKSEEWLKLCDPNCKQKDAFPNCTLCDIALEYRYCKQKENNMSEREIERILAEEADEAKVQQAIEEYLKG